VSALDVSVRAEVMNLLTRLRTELDLTYVFISHDLGMVRHLCDRIAVMYLGQIVEHGPWREVSDQPAHPYSRALHAAVPVPDPSRYAEPQPLVRGEVPMPPPYRPAAASTRAARWSRRPAGPSRRCSPRSPHPPTRWPATSSAASPLECVRESPDLPSVFTNLQDSAGKPGDS